jgi:hypothetical protein
MKRGILFVLGILVGVGLTLGVMQLRRDGQPGSAGLARPKQESVSQRTESDAQTGAAKPDGLATKIARLQRWSQGKEPALKREEALKLLEDWSVLDPQAALAFVVNAPRIPRRNQVYAIPLAVLCARDSKTVIDWMYQNIAAEQDRGRIAESIIARIKDSATFAALELAAAPNIPVGIHYFGELMGVVARTQPQVALQQLERLSSTGQVTAVGSMLNFWAQTNPREALTWYLATQKKYPEAAAPLIEGCVKSGVFQIGDLVQRLGLTTSGAEAVLVELSQRGVLVDAQELGLLSAEEKQNVARQISWRLEENPDRVVRLLKATLPSAEYTDAISEGWENWLRSDRKAAVVWLEQQPDRQLADEINQRWQQQELARDPVKALAALPGISDAEKRKWSATNALEQLASDKPEQAIAWLSQHQAEPVAPEFYDELARFYLRRDDAAAMDWIAKLGNGEAKDGALRAAADYWSGKEIDFATTSMAAIGDEQKRQACMFNLYSRLTRKDSPTAEQWLEQQGLSPEVRQSWKALASGVR